MRLLAKGVCVTPGVVVGKSRIINSVGDLDKITNGDIIVLPRSDPQYALGIYKAGAVICEMGGVLSHLCIVSMEMGIPCITQTPEARKLIPDDAFVFVDATNGEVSLYTNETEE